jgi:serine/threonine protein kinase
MPLLYGEARIQTIWRSNEERVESANLLGKYRLLATLGHGGMADVYLAVAQGPAGFNKLLVIKELRPGLAQDPEFLSMFMDEARLAARLHHPNVVQTYEAAGVAGRYYIAMEYLDGQPLNRLIAEYAKGEGLPLSAGLRILCEALSGLHYAHELADYDGRRLAVVHRDVTPHNLFVTYDGEVKLVDFGIAKAAGSSSETRIGMLKGKVGYMAPEQARAEDVDRRTDIYGMGVILWELLARHRMWRGVPDVTILSRLAADQVPDLAADALDLPSELLRICARATAPRAEERYATAEEFRSELEQVLELSGTLVDRRYLAEIVSDAFAAERERMRGLIQVQLQDATLLPIALERSYSGRSGSFDSLSTSQRLLALTPTSSLSTTPGPTISNLDRGAPSQELATAMFSQPRTARLTRKRLMIAGIVLGSLTALVTGLSRHLPGSSGAAPAPSARTSALITAPAPPPKPETCQAPNKPRVELSGDIERDALLTCDKDYILRFNTYVKPGITLTIQAGTRLLGDKATQGALVVEPGARLVARGTPQAPIVFTSQEPPGMARPGDWGGVLLLGRAPINLRDRAGASMRGRVEGIATELEYGGDEPADDSGVLSFVRIEYSGNEIAPGNEINGLTLAGVGSRTQLDHIQVRHTADDCFEFFGGTVNAKYLVCQRPGDDAFDWDLGYTGKLQFLLLKDDPEQENDSNGFEGDNDPNSSSNQPISKPTIYNVTLCGPNRKLKREHYGALLRRGTQGLIANGIFSGFGAGVDVRDASTAVEIRSSIFAGNLDHDLAYPEQPNADGPLRDDDGGLDEARFLLEPARRNRAGVPVPLDCSGSSGFAPRNALTENAEAPPSDGFFDASAAFIGAVRDGDDDWARAAWLRWD